MKQYLINLNCKQVKRNTILISKGEVCKELYFVEKGCLRIYYLTRQGKETTRYVAFEDSIVTSTSSFISQKPSFEFVESLENSEIWAINYTDFFQLVSNIPEWDNFYRKLLEKCLFNSK